MFIKTKSGEVISVYPNGEKTKQQHRLDWIMGGKIGVDPWPPATTPELKAVRRMIDTVERQHRLGKYAPMSSSPDDPVRQAKLHLREQRRKAGIAATPRSKGPTQLEIAELWLRRGKPVDEPVPALVQQRRAAAARSKLKRQALAAVKRAQAVAQPHRVAVTASPGRPDEPLTNEARVRLMAWCAIWDACAVPDEFREGDVRFGLPVAGARSEVKRVRS